MGYHRLASDELTHRQQRFCDLLLADPSMNATDAYLKAGYKGEGRTCYINASRLLKSAKVQHYLGTRIQERALRTQVEQDSTSIVG